MTMRSCVVCGCTDARACPGGCSWVSLDPPICSACCEEEDAGGRALIDSDAVTARDVDRLAHVHQPFFTSSTAGHCVQCGCPVHIDGAQRARWADEDLAA